MFDLTEPIGQNRFLVAPSRAPPSNAFNNPAISIGSPRDAGSVRLDVAQRSRIDVRFPERFHDEIAMGIRMGTE
jgi:hypothetical protein